MQTYPIIFNAHSHSLLKICWEILQSFECAKGLYWSKSDNLTCDPNKKIAQYIVIAEIKAHNSRPWPVKWRWSNFMWSCVNWSVDPWPTIVILLKECQKRFCISMWSASRASECQTTFPVLILYPLILCCTFFIVSVAKPPGLLSAYRLLFPH